MDLQKQLQILLNDEIKKANLNLEVKNVYPDPRKESITLNSLPGSTTTKAYMDGSYDMDIIYEIRVQSSNAEQADRLTWAIDEFIKAIDSNKLVSGDNSFLFTKVDVSNAPFMSGQREDGFFIFITDFKISVFVDED